MLPLSLFWGADSCLVVILPELQTGGEDAWSTEDEVKIALLFLAERVDDYDFQVRLSMVEGLRRG